MSKVIKIKKGLDIKLKGEAEKVCVSAEKANLFAVKPPDFVGLTPKMKVKPDEKVKAGAVEPQIKADEKADCAEGSVGV